MRILKMGTGRTEEILEIRKQNKERKWEKEWWLKDEVEKGDGEWRSGAVEM